MTKRKYTPNKRARQQERTRQKIVEAAMALHEELGPRNTTIKGVAEKAGVQRLTVYRHFPDEGSLFSACTSHWLELHPLPTPEDWAGETDPLARCHAAFARFYAYYRQTRRMVAGAYRDMEEVPALAPQMERVLAHLDEVRDDLARAWPGRARQKGRLRATIGHCLDFPTWQSLERQGLPDDDKAALAARWVACAAQGEIPQA